MFTAPTPEIRALFKQLHEDRTPDGNTLRRHPGIFNIIVEQYQDSAHFVYELLQNADDTKAEKARFTLTIDGLVYAHVGTPFTITPAGEEIEKAARRSGKLGDVNALCSLAGSNKVSQVDTVEQKMGKFGIGFKAVSLYTDTPHVYDRRFAFRLKYLIVPELLEEADEVSRQRASNETLFWLPFDRKPTEDDAPGRTVPTPQQSFEQIANKLRTLRYPLLFLRHLRQLDIKIIHPDKDPEELVYTCNPEEVLLPVATKLARPCHAHLITIKQPSTAAPERWLVFSRSCTAEVGLDVRLAYAIGPDGQIMPAEYDKAFCYFSTARSTKLKFLVQAPWLLTASRENLKAVPENEQHMRDLAALAADSLLVLRDLRPRNAVAGTATSKEASLLTDRILTVLPIDGSGFGAEGDQAELSFQPIFKALHQALATERLLPTKRSGHVTAKEGWWAETPSLNEALGKSQLRDLVGAEAAWVFPTVSRFDEPNPLTYIQSIVGKEHYLTADAIGRRLASTPAFFEQPGQTDGWMTSFYRYIGKENRSMLEANRPLRKAAFLRLADGTHAVPWDDNNELQIYLPRPYLTTDIATLKECFATDRKLVAFRELLRLSEPQLLDTVRRHILPRYGREEGGELKWPTDEEHFAQLADVLKCWREASLLDRERLRQQLSELPFILGREIGDPDTTYWCTPEEVYTPTPELSAYFEFSPDTLFVAEDLYSALLGDTDSRTDLLDLWQRAGVTDAPRAVTKRDALQLPAFAIRLAARHTHENVYQEAWQYCTVDGLLPAINADCLTVDLSRSILHFTGLKLASESARGMHLLESRYLYCHRQRGPSNPHNVPLPSVNSPLYDALHNHAWLYAADGVAYLPNRFPGTTDDLHPAYDLTQPGVRELLRELGIKEPASSKLAGLTPRQLIGIRLAEEASEEELREFRANLAEKRRQAANQTIISTPHIPSPSQPLLRTTHPNPALPTRPPTIPPPPCASA